MGRVSGAVIQAAILLPAIAAALCHDTTRTEGVTFLRWATKVRTGKDIKKARRWHHRPYWQRAAVQAGAVILAGETAAGLMTARQVTLTLLPAAALAGAATAAWRGWQYARHWGHHRQVAACRDEIGQIIGVRPWQMTARPGGSRLAIPLPYATPIGSQQREAVADTVNRHFPAAEVLHGDWSEARGRRPFSHFTRHVPPPVKVTAADILPAIEKASEHQIVFGLAGGGVPYVRSLDADLAHLGFSMKSGGGKTTAAKSVGAQVLHHGGIVIILDNKLLSHMQFDGLPNVVYAYTPQMIHEALLWLAWDEWQESELTYRKKLGRANSDIDGNVLVDLGPRVLIIAEELNSTQRMLKRYWRQIGGKGPSPASEALDELSNAGRQFKMHVLYIGQRLSAKATSGGGSADSRENVGLIVFYNPSKGTWDLLTDGHEKPPDSTVKGRYQIVDASGVTAVQGALWTGKEARDFAMSGIVAQPHRDLPFTRRNVVPVPGRVAVQGAADQGIVLRQTPVPLRPPDSMTLREATDAGMFGAVELETVRKRAARKRLGHVGWEGKAMLYDHKDLKELVR